MNKKRPKVFFVQNARPGVCHILYRTIAPRTFSPIEKWAIHQGEMEHARARPFGVRAMMATARGGQWTPTRRRWAAGGTFRREFAESRHRRRQRRGRTRGRSRTRRQLARVSSHFPRATRRAASIDVGALPLAPDEKYIAERTGVPHSLLARVPQ